MIRWRRRKAKVGLHWKTQIVGELLSMRDGVFIDVGANIGQTFDDYAAASRQGGYIGFEPNPECVVRLMRRAAAEPGSVIIPAAITQHPGLVRLHVPGGDSASATLREDLRPGRCGLEMWVVAVTFEDAFNALGRPAIAVVKIDVEGSELEVLRSMTRALREQRPPILCEVLRADSHADLGAFAERMRLLDHLLREELHYRAQRIVKAGERLVGVAPVNAFPAARWTLDTAEDCDYLLVHDDRKA